MPCFAVYLTDTCLRTLCWQNKLELITGGSAATMRLSVFDKQDQFVCHMDSETALLGSFPVDEGMRLHVSRRGPGHSPWTRA